MEFKDLYANEIHDGYFDGEVLHLYIYDRIDFEMSNNIIKKLIDNSDKDRIVLHICSTGGEYYPTLSLINYIRTDRRSFIAINEGTCESCALYIYLNCNKRYSYKSSIFMYHDLVHTHQYDNTININNYQLVINDSFYISTKSAFIKCVEECADVENYKKWLSDGLDHYFTTEEAFLMGILPTRDCILD